MSVRQNEAPTNRVAQNAADAGKVIEYLEKVEFVADQIEKRIFFKRPGKWCRQCEFLPACLGDKKRTKETLKQIG